MKNFQIIPVKPESPKQRRCLSCGTQNMKPGRRYCTKECRQQIQWVLSLSKGLLKTFNARYAAFTFSDKYVILDVLPVWSKSISRFFSRRISGKKPAEDLKNLILESGERWYRMIDNKHSGSSASLHLLNKNHNKSIAPDSIKPDNRIKPRFSKNEKVSMKLLRLKLEEVFNEGSLSKIKSAYKKLAKVHHPDKGGDAEKFKKLNEAHQKMLLWAENPQFSSRKALIDCWSFNGATNKWSPPL